MQGSFKFFKLCLGLLGLLLCTSCFEITEEIELAEDGSGTFRLTINASESKRNLANYMKLDEVEGVRIPSRLEIEQNLIKVKGLLGMVQGMEEVRLEKDFDNFVFKIAGAFNSVETFNRAIQQVALGFDPGALPYLDNAKIEMNEHSVHRKFSLAGYVNVYHKLNSTGQFIMEEARVRSIMRLGRPIKKVSNPKAKISPSQTSVMLLATLAELSNAQISLDNKISF